MDSYKICDPEKLEGYIKAKHVDGHQKSLLGLNDVVV